MRLPRLPLLAPLCVLVTAPAADAGQGLKLRGDQRLACWMLEIGHVRALPEAEVLAGRVRNIWKQLHFADDPVGPPPPDAPPAPKKKKPKKGEYVDETPGGIGLEAVTLYRDGKPGPIRLAIRCLNSRAHAERLREEATSLDPTLTGLLVYDDGKELLVVNKGALHKPPE